jgi:hypothetical protein
MNLWTKIIVTQRDIWFLLMRLSYIYGVIFEPAIMHLHIYHHHLQTPTSDNYISRLMKSYLLLIFFHHLNMQARKLSNTPVDNILERDVKWWFKQIDWTGDNYILIVFQHKILIIFG